MELPPGSLAWTQVVPCTLCVAAFLTLLSGVTLRQTFHRGMLWGILCVAVGVAAPFVFFQISLTDPPSVSVLILTIVHLKLELFDAIALCWLPLSTLLLLLLLNWPQASGTSPETFRRETLFGLLLAATVQWASLSADAWVQWGLLAFSGWMLAFILARDTSDNLRGKGAAACLVWLTVADLLWLLGLTGLSLILPVSDLISASNPELLSQLSEGQIALCVPALSLLLGGLILRCGLSPLMSWTAPATKSFRDATWMMAFGFGSAMIILLRWLPLFSGFAELRLMLTGIGGLSALLLALMAWGGSRGPARLVHACASQLSLAWMGLGIDPSRQTAPLAFTCILIWLLGIFALGLNQLRERRANWKFIRSMLFLTAGLATLGLFGQEQIWEVVFHSQELQGVNRGLLLGTFLLSHALVAQVLFREIQIQQEMAHSSSTAFSTSQAGLSTTGWVGVMLVNVPVLLGILFGPQQFRLVETMDIELPFITGLLMLIGLVVALTWPQQPAVIRAGEERQEGGSGWKNLRRMSRSEFYLPAMIHVLILLPIRVAAQVSRFLEWMVLGNLTMKLPALLWQGIGDHATLADEESDEPTRMWRMVSAVAVMLAGVALGMLISPH